MSITKICREIIFKHLPALDSADLSVAITTEDDGDAVVITIYDPEMDYDFDFNDEDEVDGAHVNSITDNLMHDLTETLAMTEFPEIMYDEDEQEWVITLPVNLDTDADISHSADS